MSILIPYPYMCLQGKILYRHYVLLFDIFYALQDKINNAFEDEDRKVFKDTESPFILTIKMRKLSFKACEYCELDPVFKTLELVKIRYKGKDINIVSKTEVIRKNNKRYAVNIYFEKEQQEAFDMKRYICFPKKYFLRINTLLVYILSFVLLFLLKI